MLFVWYCSPVARQEAFWGDLPLSYTSKKALPAPSKK